ncbi:MAG: amidohydrolase family protein [Candidatus Eisenbacteria bacterium]
MYLLHCRYVDWKTCEIRTGHLHLTEGPEGGIEFLDELPEAGGANSGARNSAGASSTSRTREDATPQDSGRADANSAEQRIDCRGRIVTRAFAVGHHHLYSALARGMPAPAEPPQTFVQILERIWWKLDQRLDESMIRASAMVGAMEAVRCGSTWIVDHRLPTCGQESLHIIAAALEGSWASHLLCYELSDRDGPDCLAAGLEETERYLETHPGLVGLHASFTVSDSLLARAVDLARRRKTGIHIHVAEALSDQEDAEARFGRRGVERLADAGALDLSPTLLVHCLHLTDEERELIRNSAAWVVHNPESNQNNGVGRFDPRGLGDRILLGTDGMHSDMLSSCRAAFLEGTDLSPADAYHRLRRVHDYLETHGFARAEEGDLVVLDYDSPTPITSENWPGHLVYGIRSHHVHTVISRGRVVVEAGRIVTVDAERELAIAREQATRLWEKLR